MTGLVKRKAQMLSASILVIASVTASPVMAQIEPVSFTNEEGTTTTLTPQADGFDMTVQDARGVTTTYGYNGLGQLQFEDAPERGLLSYSYDELDRPYRVEMQDGIASRLSYDDQNRVTRQVWREGSDEKIATRYTYDTCENGENKLCRVVHNDHVMRYGYTPDGKLALAKAKLADEDAVETIRYRYGDDGRLESMRYPSGLRVAYRYDEQGRVSALTGVYETGDDRERFVILRAITYDDATGLVVGFTHGNRVKTRYSYDSDGRLFKITRKHDGEVIGEDAYSYNADGLIDAIDRLNSADSRRYGYDSQGRLIHEAHGDGTSEGSTTIGYSYDVVGNRLARTVDGHSKNYNYAPDANQLQSIGQQNLTYDARGNLRKDRAGRRSFDYDATNRMDAFYRNGELRAEYDYDANGRRIRKILHRPDDDGVKSVRFLYDTDGRLISETSRRDDRSAVKARDLVWLGPIAVAQVERRVKADGTTKKANVLSLHTDHLGTPRLAKDSEGTTVWSWYGDAFGAKAGDTPAVDRDPDGDGQKTEVSLRFPGQYHDRESGLWYNHHRDYDAKVGRYIQSDPIGLAGGVNRYGYVSGKPTYLIDPKGLAEQCFFTSTGYTPGLTDSEREEFGDPSGPEPSDQVMVNGVATQNPDDPRQMCIYIPDTGPIPSTPTYPSIPTQPTGPTSPSNDDDGGDDTDEVDETCQLTPTSRGDVTIPPGFSPVRVGGTDQDPVFSPFYMTDASGNLYLTPEWTIDINAGAQEYFDQNGGPVFVGGTAATAVSGGIAVAGISSQGAVAPGGAVAIGGTAAGLVGVPIFMAGVLVAYSGNVNATTETGNCPITTR